MKSASGLMLEQMDFSLFLFSAAALCLVAAAILFYRSRRVSPESFEWRELRTKIEAFENLVREFHLTEAHERVSLSKAVQTLSEETGVLTQIFRSDQKSQGDFGEVVLETILSSAGLRAGEDFQTQQTVQVGDSSLRPDVIVRLPEGRHIVIDSKVSMKAWDAYARAGTDLERAEAIELHIAALRRQVQNLAERHYPSANGLNSPDFVFLFTPIEAAWIEAIRFEPSLLDEAWAKRVVVVSPTTLYAALKTVAALWTRERQNQNARIIAREAGELHQQIGKFWSELEGIEADLRKSLVRVEGARRRSAHIVEHVERLRELGAESPTRLATMRPGDRAPLS